jgi:hypothetical protein
MEMSAEPVRLEAGTDADASVEAAASRANRRALVTTDDLGISVSAELRLQPIDAGIKALFDVNPDEHLTIVERSLLMGLTTLASAAELTATDAARMRLEAAALKVADVAVELGKRHTEQSGAVETLVRMLIDDLRKSLADDRAEEQRVRGEFERHASEIAELAKKLDTNRETLEKKTLEAISDLSSAQSKAKEAMLEGTASTLKKLVDAKDPASAPALVKSIVDKAMSDMREQTAKGVGTLESRLQELLGEGAPFAAYIARIAREDAEKDLKRLEEALAQLREDILKERVRAEHDPTVKGPAYEDDILELLTPAAAIYGLTPQATGTLVGDTTDSKKGDHVLVDEDLVPRAAIEARARKNVSLREVLTELEGMAANRGVKVVAYFMRSTDYLPSGLGEFSRGLMPMTCKRLPGDVNAILAVIDPDDPGVAERLALVMYTIDRLAQAAGSGDYADAAERIEQALPCLEALVGHLAMFRSMKSGLTKARGEIDRVRSHVDELETTLRDDVEKVDAALRGA